ncbi:hypothetical protein K5I29_01765 [Flavobacterium agricola]|uniref:Uncharacterized protein n=1 Tax=Flavobacterium agricola TaxID=2870839 RepID=A0ABY6M2X2_9FLAO|nr:hypothetical protein [Flavobacterium agricola]UYW01678.1 hypothetical protein K5I29_01765 [Flavobacterium agricola]
MFKRPKTTAASSENTAIDYDPYAGKIIRKIIFESNDPFGYSVDDSTKTPKTWLENVGNDLHLKTKPWAIKNYLLFKENQPLNPEKIIESERILYTQKFIRKIKIIPVPIPTTTDSVDLVVRSLDAWSIIFKASMNSKVLKTEINQRNFAGLGHQFTPAYQHNYVEGTNKYQLQYRVPNIKQTFIEYNINYLKDFNNNKVRTVELKRDFFSNFTKWVGGIKYEHLFKNDTIYNLDLEKERLKYKYDQYDIWGGYAFKIFDAPELVNATHLITTTRFVNTNYTLRPDQTQDPYHFYSDTNLWLTSVGLTSRFFNKSEDIFYQGVTEYYQTGQNIFITTGYEHRNKRRRFYLGGQLSNGRNYNFGYLATTLEAGTYFNNGKTEQSLVKLSLFYMSNIFTIGDWKFRQFIVPKAAIGNNRFNVWNDVASLGLREDGIVGFNNYKRGTKKATLSLQLQSYSPKNFYGFRLNPFLSANFGTIANTGEKLVNSKVYSSFGAGIQISNDFLVFDKLQVSFIYIPTLPTQGKNIIHLNSFNNTDLALPNFEISKPEIISYF